MTIKIRRDDEISDVDGEWFRARWHFSFDSYRDPEYTSFGTLRVFNDDRLIPGAVWPMHPHKDIEGLTYVVEGLFRHQDDVGGAPGPLPAGSVQRMTLGSGAWHSEQNASETEPMNKSDATRLVTRRIAVLVFPSFPMMAFSAVIEPLRAANVISARKLYDWIIVGPDDKLVVASNGIAVAPHFSVSNAPTADYIVVCSGGDADRLSAKKPLSWIRKSLRLGAHIGSVADGAFYLARAGLLDDYACTLHWQSQPAFVEAFPHIQLVRRIFVIDRNRFTSAGGVGAFDMMLELIGSHHGDALSRKVAEWFVHDRIRATADRERLQLRLRTGIRDELVLNAVP
jgi:putative intracellular protease/amidase